ncbi:MAG: hypothetical protein KGO49_00745 [Gammaproteobacteria bacterium]|nr:hypothetical protein [Gammaproteobacteria bacterium]
MMNTGSQQRLEILRRDVERIIIQPLTSHSWVAKIDQECPDGDGYLIISACRANFTHRIAVLYSCGTSNQTYKKLEQQVDHIFYNGQPYHVSEYAYGIGKPVSPVEEFHSVMLKWNSASSGKFAPISTDQEPITAAPTTHRLLLSEEPVKAIWLRLRQMQSIKFSKKIIIERIKQDQISLDEEIILSKAEGLAYSIRNAADYFHESDTKNLSQRILNLYYGSLSLAFSEMLASPSGPKTLGEIESFTKQGHGLATIDGQHESMSDLVIIGLTQGFFPSWMKAINQTFIGAAKKPRQYNEIANLTENSWITIEQLFATIPEVSDLFTDVFEGAPRYVIPNYDQSLNHNHSFNFTSKTAPVISQSYINLIDDSTRLTLEDIALFPGPISEIREIQSSNSGKHFQAAISHEGLKYWWQALDIHHSPFKRDALILPIFGGVSESRAICVTLLYALSIIVRYRPSIWRRIQEGDFDHYRVIIETFLTIVERVLPEQFLEKITGQKVFAKQPGSMF